MKRVYQIVDLINKEVYFVKNKGEFCEKMGLTSRLLGFTYPNLKEGSKRVQLHHKGFKYVANMEAIIGSVNTKKYTKVQLWDTKEYVYILSSDIIDIKQYENFEIKLRTISDVVVEDKKEVVRKTVELTPKIRVKSNEETEEELVKAHKKIQSLMDKLRIARKLNRQNFRKESVEDFFRDEVVELLRNRFKFNGKINRNVSRVNNDTLVVQVSDLHIGKVVNMPHNQFNYDIAEQKLQKYANKVIDIVNKEDINNVVIAFTGDLFNLDSHMDSLLTNEDNRASMFVRGLDMLTEFIENIWTNVADLSIVGVLGNESRLRTTEYNSNVDKIASNNLDTLLFSILRRLLSDNITIMNDCDKLYDYFTVNDYKIGMCHGDKLKKHDDTEVNKFKLRIYETYGTMVDYVIFGHIHSTNITSTWGRSGSLCGTDHYFANGLNGVGGTSSQNIYYISEEDGIEGREIKL